MNNASVVYELLPPIEIDPRISDASIKTFETAVDALAEHRWQDAVQL